MAVVFVTNAMLNSWTDQGKVRVDGTTLHLLDENRTVELHAAVRFMRLIDGSEDPHKLVGKVKSLLQLDEMGAEHYLDSVITGDVGYYVVEGFMGPLSAVRDAPAVPAPPPPSALAPTTAPNGVPVLPRSTTLPMATKLELEALELSKVFLDTVRES